MEWQIVGLILAFFCGLAGGCSSYLIIHWAHIRFQRQLEYRVEDLEGRVIREVKIRASEASRKTGSIEKDLLEKINEEKKPEELTLDSWRKKGFVRR